MTTLFVGNLSWGTTQETLCATLGQYGTIKSCDTGTVRNGRTRGWAIVEVETSDEAEYIIKTCNDMEVDGRPLNVRLDQKPEKPSGGKGGGGGGGGAERKPRGGDPALEGKAENSSGRQVVVRNLPWSVTSEMLRGTFEQIGSVENAEVVYHADSGRSKGWGTVRFSSDAEANDAITRFGGVELAGRPMVIRMDRFA
jgi:RNA recognition motif-containing protein